MPSETWCLMESEIGVVRRTVRSTVRAICSLQLNDRIKAYDLVLISGWSDTVDSWLQQTVCVGMVMC